MNNKTFARTLQAAGILLAVVTTAVVSSSSSAEARKQSGGSEQAAAYDPNTKVYCDALWFRVHAEDCPALILKDKKKTMTLAEADQAGARIGESGQSGRENCCFNGYKRKHPEKKFTDDTILCGNDLKKNVKHVAGCHRYWPDGSHRRRPRKEWIADGFKVCGHCIERGPSVAAITDEAWNKLGSGKPFVAPEGWVPKPYSPDTLPSNEELDLLIQETLAKGNGIQELPFTDPVASMENFMTMRFFFPVGSWLHFYKAYRATGDKRILDKLLESARHYNKLSREFPSVARAKASDPEGMAFMYSMAVWSRITLQLAKKYPDQISQKEMAEAETFLKTMISVLKPICEGNDSLDPKMGIPQKLADDFRFRASNRALNGIGTIGMATAALEDLQALKKTSTYQPTIDRYRKVVGEYVKLWKSIGHLCTQEEGKAYFTYPYAPRNPERNRMVDGCKIFHRPEDQGHYTHALQGALLLHDALPELGVDDGFMTAIANAVHHNSTTKIKSKKKTGRSGVLQCPCADRKRPVFKGHPYSPARDRFYLLEAFKDGIIDGQCSSLSEGKKAQANSEYDKRLATLHAHYLKALRKDRSLVHLGEKK